MAILLKETRFKGVYADKGEHYTRNLNPGVSVYGEWLKKEKGVEYRYWDPRRSKASTILKKGCRNFPVESGSRVLYLGAATGTTVSHLSDICQDGQITAVEFSQRAFRKLIQLSSSRKNIHPLLKDATKPDTYQRYVSKVDLLYQDVSQRDQVDIFDRNARAFSPRWGILMLKARSVDVGEDPRRIFTRSRKELRGLGYDIVEELPLAPYEKDHVCFILRA